MSKTLTFRQAISDATSGLIDTSPSPRIDAEALLCHVLSCNNAYLMTWPEKTLTELQERKFLDLITKRKSGMPVAYLTGIREFWSLDFHVNQGTLIPRPETETLVEYALNKLGNKNDLSVLDLGTGSGAIALALAHEKPGWKITATDISDTSLSIASANAENLQLNNVNFVQGDWFTGLNHACFDLIISNPPYIAEDDTHLDEGDVRFEPRLALVAGKQGMSAIETISSQARKHLKADGWLVLEHGYDQKKAVYHCLEASGFKHIEQRPDLAGQPRMSAGQS